MAYSVDFRKCVLENLESGKTWDEVISIFSISRDTLSRWVNLSKRNESLEDPPRAPYKVRKIDSQALVSALEKTSDATLKELAREFNCRPSAIHKRLKKLDITRKKNDPIRRER
jgi:transposase-like protein